MSEPRIDRPAAGEYAPFYSPYVAGVPDGNLLTFLEAQGAEMAGLLAPVSEARGNSAYAPGKWTLKEVIGHISDAERVFGYRALRFARGDETPLAGFDEKSWVPQSGASDRTLADLVEEFRAVRAATLAFLRHLSPEAVGRRGTANNVPVTVRGLAWIIAGHAAHHHRIIRERYLP